jgi:hypothetical protein
MNPSNEYGFISRWRVEGTCGEVADILRDGAALGRWWPSVYLDVQPLLPADARGIGARTKVRTKGWLPYTISWQFEVVESHYPTGFTILATGDFDGRGVWTFEQDGRFVDITYDWRLRAEKPLLRNLSFALKPMFEANHRWAMARGEESLKLELLRRRAGSDAARAQIPLPPAPVTFAGVGLIAGATAVGAAVAYLVRRAARKSRS